MANHPSANAIATVAALIGDAARANILSALMGGQALTAGELARRAGVTAQTTSGHLAQLAAAHLLTLEKQGRHRYYRLASPEVAQAMHSLMTVAAENPSRRHPVGPRDEAMRLARTCYDHLAGRLVLALTDSLVAHDHLALGDGAGLLSDSGANFLCEFGVDLAERSKRPFCRTCLDWSERRPHLAGQLGAALLQRLLDLGWVARLPDTRALRITPDGHRGLTAAFDLAPDWSAPL